MYRIRSIRKTQNDYIYSTQNTIASPQNMISLDALNQMTLFLKSAMMRTHSFLDYQTNTKQTNHFVRFASVHSFFSFSLVFVLVGFKTIFADGVVLLLLRLGYVLTLFGLCACVFYSVPHKYTIELPPMHMLCHSKNGNVLYWFVLHLVRAYKLPSQPFAVLCKEKHTRNVAVSAHGTYNISVYGFENSAH